MSIIILRALCQKQWFLLKCNRSTTNVISNIFLIANYSRRSDSKRLEKAFKVVKSKVRTEESSDFLGFECSANWELLAPRGNRFYFPNAIGPAWQGVSTTIALDVPLENIIDFEDKAKNKSLLTFSVDVCPNLIRKGLHELFPTQEVVSADQLVIITLKYKGDSEKGAREFVLAAREITSRLRLHGYWADFMNPFSGKPFFSWANGKNLYKIDDRFRGLNMKVKNHNNCLVISKEHDETIFSGTIYSNAPTDYSQLRLLLNEQV